MKILKQELGEVQLSLSPSYIFDGNFQTIIYFISTPVKFCKETGNSIHIIHTQLELLVD